MNKRLKSLICIWLVAIMLVGMLPVSAAAGSSTQQPNAWIWTGTVPLREASEGEISSRLFSDEAYVSINSETPLNQQQLAAIPEGTDLLDWVRWEMGGSGGVFAAGPKTYAADAVVLADDLDGDYIFEPVFSNVQIVAQPEAENDFKPAVKVYDVSNDTTPNAYAWRAAAVKNEPGLTYQWYKQTQAKIDWESPQPSAQEESGGEVPQRSAFVIWGNNIDGTPTSDADGELDLSIELKSGDTLTVTPEGNVGDVSLVRMLLGESGFMMIGSGSAEDDGTYRVTNDTSVTATYVVMIKSDGVGPATAKLDVTAAVPVAGRTSAFLRKGDVGAEALIDGSTYLCKVSYDSYPGEGDEAEANYVYTAWSAPVHYSHANHCICGKSTHSDVGDHDEAVLTDFTAITTETELRNAAINGGNVYLANNIELTSTIEVKGNLNLCLNGHSIRPVNADTCGRAFKVESAVTFNLTDCGTTGAITDFKTTDIDGGAGVLLKNDAKFNMYGGSISGNTSYGSGGGVAIYDSSVEVGLYGGSITGNTATGNGGGVFARDYQTTIKIAGNPKVADNTNGTQASNCYQAYFQIVGPLANTAKLSINSDQLETTVSVGKYATGATGSYESCFVHDYWDSSKYVCEKDDNGNISMFQFSEIIFNANGGGSTMVSQKVPIRQYTTLNRNTFTPPSGKVFSYWSYYENGGGPDRFQDGGMIYRDSTTQTILYAIWGDPTYSISTALGITNGSVNVKSSAAADEIVTVTVTPAENYAVNTVTVKDADNNAVTVTDKGNGTYSFTMPASNVTVSVTFRKLLTGAYLGDEVITTYSGEEGVYLPMYFNGTPTTRHVDFVSSDPGVVSIERYTDNQVILNPHSAGLVTITGTTQDGGFTDTCTVYVCEISDQPTADNDYTVTVTPEDKVKYQWGKGQKITIDVEMETDGNETTIKDDLGNVATIFDFYDLYDSENQCWKPRTYFYNYGWEYAAEYFEIETARGGVLTVTPSRPLVAGESFKLVPAYFSQGSVREEIIPKADGSIIIPSESLSNSASYTLVIVKEDYEGDISTLPTVTATFTTDAYLALDGQTTKTLDTEGLEGECACCVTWDPDPTAEYIRFQKITDKVSYTAATPAPAPGGYDSTYPVVENKGEDPDGTVKFSSNYSAPGSTVTVTITPDKYYGVEKVIVRDARGNEIETTKNADGTYSFKMPYGKVTVEAVYVWENPFVDVAEKTFYIDAVEWALKNSITEGTTETTFSPVAACTRAQMVTFLWRAAGCPEPTSSECGFADVDFDSYYGKAVLWALEKGITNGTSETAFSPDMECSRAQMAAFLCRMADGKAESDENAFIDVKADAYYADSVQWAVENGITKGTSSNNYSPDATCTRGQMVTFLYRYYVK